MSDQLFDFIQHCQDEKSFGSVLDAGTGDYSLEFVSQLKTDRWTAVTGSEERVTKLRKQFESVMRPNDKIVYGNWEDEQLLAGERYDTLLVDYLVGAMDDFSPYYQGQIFKRLKQHTISYLYFIGLEPYPNYAKGPWGNMILALSRLRDACIILAGYRPYREYPCEWTIRHLKTAGFEIQAVKKFPILYSDIFIQKCAEDCLIQIGYIQDKPLADALTKSLAQLKEKALDVYRENRGEPFGEDYVIFATVKNNID